MNDDPVLADKVDQFVDDLGKALMFRQEFGAETVDRIGLFRHVALGVDVAVKFPPGRDVVHQFEAGHFDDPVPVLRIEAGRLGVDHDFPHRFSPDAASTL